MTAAPKSTRTASQAEELALTLGHNFAKLELLQQALTHPSLAGFRQRKKGAMAYERLEFLGDRVLGLIIAHWLYETYPEASEGELAKRHAALVNREALRKVALDIGLGKYLRLARGEEADSGRKNLATLSDALEAVLGALYLDGGLTPASAFIHRFWQRDIAIDTPDDPKTALQEWAQAQGLPLPAYRVVERSGPAHAPKFIVEASIKGSDPVSAAGNSKREAEKAAAQLLLAQTQPPS